MNCFTSFDIYHLNPFYTDNITKGSTNHQYDIINSSRRDHPSPWGIAARLHISYRGDISLWYNNVESLAVSTAWNDKIKLLNFPNSVWWVMNLSGSRALSSFTKDTLIVFRLFSAWHGLIDNTVYLYLDRDRMEQF